MPVTIYALYSVRPMALNGTKLPTWAGPKDGFWELTVPREGRDDVRPGEPVFQVRNILSAQVPMGVDVEYEFALSPEKLPLERPLQVLLYNQVAVLVSDGWVIDTYEPHLPSESGASRDAPREGLPSNRVTIYNVTWEPDLQLELNGRELPRFEPGTQFGWLELERSKSGFPDQSTLYTRGLDEYMYEIDLAQFDAPGDSFALFVMQGLILVADLFLPNTSQLLTGEVGG